MWGNKKAVPKVSSFDILSNNIFYKLYISETNIFTDSHESVENMTSPL